MLYTGNVTWEEGAVVAAVGDDGGEKKIGGYSGNIRWNGAGEGEVYRGGFDAATCEGWVTGTDCGIQGFDVSEGK